MKIKLQNFLKPIGLCVLLIASQLACFAFDQSGTIYFDNTNSKFENCYFYIGKSSYSSQYCMTRVSGTQYLWTGNMNSSDWNGTSWGGASMWYISSESWWGCKGSSNENIYKYAYHTTKTMTMKYESAYTTNYVYPASSTLGDITDYSQSKKGYAWSSNLKYGTYAVTINNGTGGTVTVKDYDNNTVSSGASKSYLTVLKVNVTPSDGYTIKSVTIGGTDYTSAAKSGEVSYTMKAATTIAVTYEGTCTAPTSCTLSNATAANYCIGGSAQEMTATANNTVESWQWEKSTDNKSTWSTISGATTAKYTPSTSESGTTYYRCKATGCSVTKTSDASGAIVVYPASSATTGSASSIGTTTATLAGTYTAGGTSIEEAGFAISTTSGSGYTNYPGTYSSGSITLNKTGLTSGTKYYYKAYVTDGCTTKYGTESNFTTETQYFIKGDFGDSWEAHNFDSNNQYKYTITSGNTGDKSFVVCYKTTGDDVCYKGGSKLTRNNLSTTLSTSGSDASINLDVTGEYTFTWDADDKEISVSYPTAYTATATVGDVKGGTVTIDTETAASTSVSKTIVSGGTATFKAEVSSSAYTFLGWGTTSGATSYVSTSAEYAVTMSADKTLYAIFGESCTAPTAVSISGSATVALEIPSTTSTLTATATGSSNYVYNWTITSNPNSGASLSDATAQAPTVTFTKTGTYKFKAGAKCSSASSYVESDEYTVTVSEPTGYYFWVKHPWGGDSWTFQEMSFSSTGECAWTYTGIYGGDGCNIGKTTTETAPSDGTYYGSPTLSGSPATGDLCEFKYVPATAGSTDNGTVTITKIGTPPTVTTAAVTTKTTTTATLGGSYTGGTLSATGAGIEWTSGKSGTVAASSYASPFTVNVTDLEAGTTYKYKAYITVTDDDIKVYGSEVEFTTLGGDYYLKHPWGGGGDDAWSWQKMTYVSGTTYTLSGDDIKWGDNGCNYNTTASDDGSTWIQKSDITGNGNVTTGQKVTFTFDSDKGTLSVASNCTTPAASNFTVTNNSKTYTGSAQTATVTADDGMGTMTVKYAGSTTGPTNVGTYAMTVSVAAGTTFCASTSDISIGTFTITKADQSALTFEGSTQCETASVTLSASGGSSGETITYSVKSGSGSITNGVLTASAAGDVVVTATRPGGTNYNDVTADATFTFIATPTVYNVSADVTSICSGNSTSITLSNSQTNYTYKLHAVGSATAINTLTGTTGNSLTFNNVNTAGEYGITGYKTQMEGCSAEMSGTVTITVNDLPTIDSSTDASRCGTGTVTLQATASTGATVRWYDVETSGTSLGSGTSYTTASLSATKTYYAEAYNETTGCVSSSRTGVTATIIGTPSTPSIGVFNYAGSCTTTIVPMSGKTDTNKYLLVRYVGASPTVTNPVNGTTYTAGTSLGAGTVVCNSDAAEYSDTELDGSKQYTYVLYQYTTSCYCYSAAAKKTTELAPPTVTTADASGVSTGKATLGGSFSSRGRGLATLAYGIEWTATVGDVTSGTKVQFGTDNMEPGSFSKEISFTTAGTYKYRAYVQSNYGGDCAYGYGEEKSVTITTCTAPSITTQPSATATYCKDATATALTVVASGTTLSYQWKSSSSASGTYSDISGATSSSYTPSTATAGTTYYKCYVSNTCGNATSDAAAVTVDATSVAGSVAGAEVCSGSSATLTVTGYTGSIQWQKSTDGSSYSDITGATSATYTTDALTSTTYYKVEVTNGTCAAVTSDPATVTVKAKAIAQATGSAFSTTVDASETKTFTFTQCGYEVATTDITVVGTDAGQFSLSNKSVSGENISVDVTFTPTSTGSKNASIQILDSDHQFAISATGNCKSGVAASNYNFTNNSVTYNGSEQAPTISAKDATVGAVTTVYYDGTSATGKTNAGTYAITIDSNDGTKYCGASKLSLGNFTIGQKAPTTDDFTVTGLTGQVYDGTAKTVTVAVKSGISGMGDVTVKYDGEHTYAGSYAVTYSVAAGTNYSATTTDLSAGTLVISKADQTADVVVSDLASTCGLGDYTLQATGGNGDGDITFALVSGSATLSGSTLTVTAAGDVKVKAMRGASTNYNASSYGSEKTFTFKTVPEKPGDITSETSVFCPKLEYIISIDPVEGATGYTWNRVVGTGGFNVVGQSPAYTAKVITGEDYVDGGTVTVTADNACGSSEASVYTLHGPVTPTITSLSASATEVCAGATVTITATASNVSTCEWSVPDGWTKTASDLTSATYTTGGSGTGTVTYTAKNSCGKTGATATQSVTVNALPTISLGDAVSVYPWEYTTITATVSGSPTLTWKLYEGSTELLSGAGHGTYYTFTKVSDTEYKLKGISSSGSSSSTTFTVKVDGSNTTTGCAATQATKTITVNAKATEDCN